MTAPQPIEASTGTRLRALRISAGLTQAQLGARVGRSATTIGRYEVGSRQPSDDTVLQLEHALRDHTGTQPGLRAGSVAYPPTAQDRRVLHARVVAHLESQGFHITSTGALAPVEVDKARLRALHREAVDAGRERSRGTLARAEPHLLKRLAAGRDVNPSEIDPRLVHVVDRRSADGLLWRWCSLHWSIPVSSGYGRRLRFLVVDAAHDDRVMGLIGLDDPVFAMGCRDTEIGWTHSQKSDRLASVMDAFVLGAVPPYDRLLGGKLVALLAGATEVREHFATRYGHRTTLISQRDPHAQLALVTTTSALGRSSVYNRLRRPGGELALRPVGYTRGTGDFHFSGDIYADLARFAARDLQRGSTTQRHARWTGEGFRNRREVIQRALDGLGFDSRVLRVHGIKREVFLNPLAANSYEWLRGENDPLDWYPSDAQDLADWWRDRWAVPRSRNDSSWQRFEPDDWRLYT